MCRITTKMKIIFQSKYFAENMAFLRIQIAIFFLFWIHFNAKGVKTREFITCIKNELWLNIATVCISHISNPTIHNHNLQSFCHYVTVVFSYRSLQMLFFYDCVCFFFSSRFVLFSHACALCWCSIVNFSKLESEVAGVCHFSSIFKFHRFFLSRTKTTYTLNEKCASNTIVAVTCKSIIIHTLSKCDDTKQTMLIFLYLHFASQFALCRSSFIFINVERVVCKGTRVSLSVCVCVCNENDSFLIIVADTWLFSFAQLKFIYGQACKRKEKWKKREGENGKSEGANTTLCSYSVIYVFNDANGDFFFSIKFIDIHCHGKF